MYSYVLGNVLQTIIIFKVSQVILLHATAIFYFETLCVEHIIMVLSSAYSKYCLNFIIEYYLHLL